MRAKAAELSAIPEGRPHCVRAAGANLILVRSGGEVHALENRCPHLNLPMGRGRIVGGQIVCPFHGSRFDVRTGENTDWVSAVAGMTIPTWSRALLAFGKKPQPVRTTYPVTIEGEDVFVEV